jgi:flagellar basal body-associated protein FliL
MSAKIERLTIIKILSVVITIVIIAVSFWMGRNNQSKINIKYNSLIVNGSFAIGVVTGDSKSTVGDVYLRNSLDYQFDNYDYYIKDTEVKYLKEIKNEWILNFLSAKKGEKYLVLYEKENKDNSILCLDKSIKDNMDYDRYVKEILLLRENK